jgi:uncharacterized repeat protein (TIGR02543 family)
VADFDAGYGGRIELYSITINSYGDNPTAIDTTVKIESIISKEDFAAGTEVPLDEITLPVHVDADEYTLTTNVVGNGTVAKNPNAATYPAGSVVTLTATPASSYVFSGWSGDLTGSTNPVTITMNTNHVVTATFLAVVTRSLTAGWNLLALPLQPPSALTAEALLDDIASQGGTCSEVSRWQSGTWNSHIKDTPFGDFNLVLGQSYFVRCSGTTAAWQLRGTPLSTGVSVSLLAGWNLLSVPYPTGLLAQDVLTGIVADGGTCSEIDRWVSGTWNAHLYALPGVNNFALLPTDGYFVRCSTGTTYTP